MRIDNQAFTVENQAQAREPRFVFAVDFGDDDVYFLTSHSVTGLSGANVIDGVLVTASGTSQRLNPDKANSEIGSISFTVLDQGLTDLQREKLAEGKGLKGKRVEFYVGSEALDWSSYIRATTQIIDDVSYRDRAYKFKCADIQRQMRKKIFEIKETTLGDPLGLADNRIRVDATADFERVWQPESPTGITTAPGMRVGFLRIDGDNDEFEVVMYTGATVSEFEVASHSATLAQATVSNASSVTLTDASAFRDIGFGQIDGQAIRWGGKNGNTLINCSGVPAAEAGAEALDLYGRGMFGTRPAAVDIRDESDRNNNPKVEEFIYLEMPAPMLAYALLTGAIYGYPGEYLPDHWHLGIAAEYIRTSEYIGIGEDLWNLDNFDVGLPAQFLGLDGTDGKQFIEEELFRMMGCYAPIYADGQIGLRRMSAVVSRGGFSRELNATNVASYSDLTHDMGAVINQIVVIWNYSLERGGFTRVNVLIDPDSISQHGEADQKELEFRGLSGSRVAYPTIKGVLDSLRDRYAGPPLRLTLTLTPDQNDLEVGDIVRVVLDQVKDYTGETVDGHLDRNFEVQRVQTDWRTGEVRVELFGSSQPASALPPEQSGAPIPNSWYESEGTEISAANFPGAASSSGGITTVEDDITLAGGETLSDGIYWCGEDLTFAGGVTVTVTDNVQLRVRGFFQNNAVVNGRGLGLVGGQGVQAQTAPVPVGASRVAPHLSYEWTESNLGEDGYLQADVVPQLGCFNSGAVFYHALYKHKGNSMRSGGRFVKFPALSLQIEDGALTGLPADLRGSGGPGGGPVVGLSGTNLVNAATGGDGGRGGAGLAVICRGAEIGGTGYIDLSGELGGRGALYDPAPSSGLGAYSGSGAGGGPGGLLFALDGTTATRPTIEGSTFKAEIGALDVQGQALTNFTVQGDPVYTTDSPSSSYPLLTGMGGLPNGSPLLPGGYGQSGGGTPVENRWAASFYVQALAGEIAPTPDLPENTENPTAVTLQEATNTPRSANANLSTIEVGVQPPSVSNYAYGLVEYREKGQSGWFEVGPASPEATFVVPSDGRAYEVQVRGVSRRGKVNQDGTIAEITTTKVRTPGDEPGEGEDDETPETPPAEVVPAPPVTGLELFEQGNDTVFGGRDAKFVWRKTSVTEWFEMGQEGEQGAGSGGLDLYFRDYQVEVWAEVAGLLQLVRTEWVNDPQFVYTGEKNAEDHQRENGAGGAWREFELRVYCRGRQNQISKRPARLAVSNPPPALPDAITITPSLRSVAVEFKAPEDLDYRHTRVWLSATSGFTPDDDTLAAQVDGSVALQGLTDGATYYIRIASYDAFGQGEMSPEFSVTTQTIGTGDVEGLQDEIGDLQDAIGEKGDILFQATEPGAVYQNDHTMWVDTSLDANDNPKNTPKRWDGSAWVAVSDQEIKDAAAEAYQAAQDAQDLAEGKSRVLVQSTTPAAEYENDKTLWIDTTNGANTPKHWDGSEWVSIQDGDIAQAKTDISDIKVKKTIALDANGNITGVENIDGTEAGQFNILSDNFNIVDPGDPGGTPLVPFTVTGGTVYANNLMITHTNLEDGSVDLAGPAITGQISSDLIEDGAVLKVTQRTSSPDTLIFDGTDEGVWKEVGDLDVTILGTSSAVSMNLFFAFQLDQVTEASMQAGPGGPDVEFRLVRVDPNDPEDRLIVWNPDPVMASGSGRAAIEFNATLDTGMESGDVRYVAEAKWSKGAYDAGTVDYTVEWNNDGEARLQSNLPAITWNGAFPTTYMGEGWDLTLEGTGMDPRTLTSKPFIVAGTATLIEGWLDYRSYVIATGKFYDPSQPQIIRLPSLDDIAKAGTSEELTNQPYSATNNKHKVVGSLTEYRMRSTEYRGES